MENRDKLYIDGAWVPSSGTETVQVIDSTTEEVLATVPLGTAEDVDRAVAAARAAFDGWAATSPSERAKYTSPRSPRRSAARMDEIGQLIAHEVGMPLSLSMMIQAGLPIATFSSMAELVEQFAWEDQVGNSVVVREPVGVVAAITPWNYPLHQIAAKVAPALAAGCTVVLKPSEVAPLNAFLLAEVIDEVGLPAGVFNLVSGTGPVVGEALAAHPEVDMVSFTGSTRAGKRVAEVAAATVKRVALELGGKSANVILPDADFERAVSTGVTMCYLNSGQTCSALTRMLVPRRPPGRGRGDRRPGGRGVDARRARSRTAPESVRSSPRPSATGCAPYIQRGSTRAPSSRPAAPRRRKGSTRASSSVRRSFPRSAAT